MGMVHGDTKRRQDNFVPIAALSGNQFMRARALFMPVVIIDARTYQIASATDEERVHVVQFDDADEPTACSCTCKAGVMRMPCWAMARALDALTIMGVHRIYLAVSTELSTSATSGDPPRRSSPLDLAAEAGLSARIEPDGGMTLRRVDSLSGNSPAADRVLVG